MKHTTRTRIFKILALLPNRLGYPLYYFLQNFSSKSALEKKIQATKNSYEVAFKIFRENHINLEGKRVAELGSGWMPIFPYQLILEGNVNRVDTYDINGHYNLKQIKKVNDYYRTHEGFKIEQKGKYQLHKAVYYFPKTNICNGDLKSVDLIVSRFVLEHVPPKEIKKMHDFFNSNLKSGSYILHLISPSDHRAYNDPSLSLQDFLKYSKEEWDGIQTKFDYHNRLRLPQYLALFEKEFDIVYFEHDTINTKSVAYNKFKELAIHEDFSQFNERELIAGSINILLRKK